MADVALHRAYDERVFGLPPRPIDCRQGVCLNRIAQRSARTMGFDVADLKRLHAGISQGLPDHGFLCRTIRCRDAAAAPILIDCRTAQHGQDVVIGR